MGRSAVGIRELSIKGFRSLRDVTWRPGKLNVVIGPGPHGEAGPSFFERWLDPQLPQPIGIKIVRFDMLSLALMKA